jgi:serine/threonine protein kinase
MGDARRSDAACIDEVTLAAFAEGDVSRSVRARVEEHAAECEDCHAVIARVAGMVHSRVDRSRALSDRRDGFGHELATGTVVGRYVVERLIGTGAMGAVYAARDPELGRVVALKLLRSSALSQTEQGRMRARLLREAKAMARLSHPDVITLYDVGTFGDQLFVAMEHVDGGTLREWRAERHRTWGEILAVYERAGSGLAAAHEAGLVHRDVKPDNVLVGRDGRVRVTDFGLARADPGESRTVSGTHAVTAEPKSRPVAATTLTGTGRLLGTPAYMAPEQLQGQPADARSDVFSFCVALYEALYGERPFAGHTILELRQAIERGSIRAAPTMTRVPRWVRTALVRGLRPTPDERFPSMRELLDALRAGQAQYRRQFRLLSVASIGVAIAALLMLLERPRPPTRAGLSIPPPVSRDLGQDPIIVTSPTPSSSSLASSTAINSDRGEPSTVSSRSDLPHAKPAPKPSHVRRAREPEPVPAPAVTPSDPPTGNNGAFILE